MEISDRKWGRVWLLCTFLLCLGFVGASLRWPAQFASTEIPALPFETGARAVAKSVNPFLELAKLAAAAAVGLLVTAVQKHYRRERPISRSLEQAEVLLAVAGAMMMIIIGSSLARALGIAGGAAIVRFRTPVEDPKDAVLLFLLLGLGMSCGIGSFAVAGLGALFLVLLLLGLSHVGEERPRSLILALVASGAEFPEEHVHAVLSRTVNSFEAREFTRGPQAVVRYLVTLDPWASLTYLSQELMADGAAGVKSVSWEVPKKEPRP
jgi:hypothetical protein